VTNVPDNPQTDDLVEVCREQGHPRAHVIKSKLEAAGIPATLSYDAAGWIFGITADGLGQVRVMVRAEDAEAAQAVLEELWPDDEDPSSEQRPSWRAEDSRDDQALQ
jgi:hypothetical protein